MSLLAVKTREKVRVTAPILLFLSLGFLSGARAGQDELVLAIEPSYGVLHGNASAQGPGAGASVWYGLNETFWLTASSATGLYFQDSHTRRGVYEGFAGMVAALDVFRSIPFVEGEGGVVGTFGAVAPAAARKNNAAVLTFRVGMGLDYLLAPNLSLGAVVRYRPLYSPVSNDGLLTVQARLGWRIELF